MGRHEFEEMLNQQNIKVSVDDSKRRHDQWLEAVTQFYTMITPWLKGFVEKKQLKYEMHKISLIEDWAGSYDIDEMRLWFGSYAVRIHPVGSEILGASGRIDMEGARGVVKFILEEKGVLENAPNSAWKIILSQSDGFASANLNEDSFFDALMEIVSV